MKSTEACIAVLLMSCAAFGDDAVPDFVTQLANDFAAQSPDTAPLEIWSYLYRGSTVYYVAPIFCCDLPGVLYDAKGDMICRAGGGIAGNHQDDNCPYFPEARENGKLLWQHPERPAD
jgi:hypothetical protein